MTASRLFLLTLAAMIAFASNSLLCRWALKQTEIDAATFTSVRLVSGAVMLWLIMKMRRSEWRNAGNWLSALALFVYAAAFSFAYLRVSAGTGALLLFGAVQATMILWGLHKEEPLRARQLGGLAVALSGLVVLLLPGLSTPPLGGSMLMLGAGIAWGVYSLRGKTASDPTAATAGNFLRAAPLALVVSLALFPWTRFDRDGAIYAVLSGAIASGLGYVIWYMVLPNLRSATAATVQLTVPILATLGGILFLGESLSLRFCFASITILGGIALVVIRPNATATAK